MAAPIVVAAIPAIIAAAKEIIERYVTDKDAKAAAQAALDKQEANEHFQIALKQIDANIEEIRAGGLIGRWRAALGWMLALSAAYQLMLVHFLTAISLWINPAFPVEKMPKLDWAELGKLLAGLVGLG